MISILTVEIEGCRRHLELFLKSVANYSKLVSEVIIAKSDAKTEFNEEWQENNIKFVRFGNPVECIWYGHALGLNAALDRAQKEYVLFSDPDTFWYAPVDEFYLQLINEYNLNYVGVSHHNGINQGFTYFPYIISSMAKRSELPDKEWMKGKLKYRGAVLHRAQLLPDDPGDDAAGKFLLPGPLPELHEQYPNKNGDAIFDIGCNLWLWNEEKNGKWLSFQTTDCRIYTTKYYRSNFGLKTKFPKQKIIYHLGSGARNDETEWNIFKEAHLASKEECDD